MTALPLAPDFDAARQPGARYASSAETAAQRIGMAALAGGAFFAPYLVWRPFDIMFTLSDALFCVAAMFLGLAGSIRTRPFGALTPWWLFGFFAMAAGLLLGSIVNGEPLRWAIAAAQYGFAFVVLPFLLLGHSTHDSHRVARAMLAGIVAMELFGIAIYFMSSGSFEENQRWGLEFISGSHRLSAFTSDANWNGAYLAMTLPFVFYLHAKRQIAGWQALIAGAVIIEGLLLAASVSALICAILGVTAMILVGGRRIPLWPLGLAAFGGMLYLASGQPLPQAFSTRIAPAIDTGNISEAGTFSGRLGLIQEAWHMVDNTMFVGLGVDQYRNISDTGHPVHNIYLLLWTEGGLFAVFGWLLLLAVLVGAAAMVYRRDRMTAALALSVTTVLMVSSTASPHMYARLWVVPVLVAMAFVFDRATVRPAA